MTTEQFFDKVARTSKRRWRNTKRLPNATARSVLSAGTVWHRRSAQPPFSDPGRAVATASRPDHSQRALPTSMLLTRRRNSDFGHQVVKIAGLEAEETASVYSARRLIGRRRARKNRRCAKIAAFLKPARSRFATPGPPRPRQRRTGPFRRIALAPRYPSRPDTWRARNSRADLRHQIGGRDRAKSGTLATSPQRTTNSWRWICCAKAGGDDADREREEGQDPRSSQAPPNSRPGTVIGTTSP